MSQGAKSDVVTQDSAALEFVQRFGKIVRYDHSVRAWYRFDSATWRRDQTAVATEWARETVRELAIGARSDSARYALGQSSFASGVERLARTDQRIAVASSVWDRDPFLLGTPRGTINLRSGELREPDPGDLISMCTTVAPAATSDCPRFLRFLDEVTGGDAELIGFLQRWFGYNLTGDVREHTFVFIHGDGRTGKGVLLNTIRNIMGAYATTAAMDAFVASYGDKHPADLAALAGKRFVGASETEKGKSWDETRIKALSGGDNIPAHFMRRDWFEITPTFKFTFIGNYKPDLKGVNVAMRGRLALVPFNCTFDAPDRELEYRLRAEWPAILRWAIEGCLAWQDGGLRRPSSVTAASDAYFREQDVFSRWIEEGCIVDEGNETMRETSAALWASWVAFAGRHDKKPGRPNEWAEGLRKKGAQSAFIERARGYSGITLRPANG